MLFQRSGARLLLMWTRAHQVVVSARFCGFTGIAHGGYLGGVVAGDVGAPAVNVELRRPVRTEVPLTLEQTAGRVELRDGEVLVAEGTAAELNVEVPEPVTLHEAEAASRRNPGLDHHLYPGCFGCGPAHPGGLRIFAGPVPGRRLVAAPWVPGSSEADEAGTVPLEIVWAALDCPQLWALILHAPSMASEKVVTAAISVNVAGPVVAGEPYVVMAWPEARNGRTWFAGAVLMGQAGKVLATSRLTAVSAKWGVPVGLGRWRPTPLPSDRA